MLTDGRVLVQDSTLEDVGWWTLTPDNTGSYVNGTWSQVASPPSCPNDYPGASGDTIYSPLYYASAVLPDGRFVMIGGEYYYNYDYYLNNGSGEVWSDQGAIYDPVANSWTCITAPSGWTQIGDAQSVVLPDGTFMMADPFNNQVVTLNISTNPPTFNIPITPSGKSADPYNDEEGWILLPDGTVLTLEIYNTDDTTETPALTYSESAMAWSSAGLAPDPLVLLSLGSVNYEEIGPAILRPDGTVFAVGATGFNDIYNTNNGVWSSGPRFPTITDTYSSGSCTITDKTEQLVAADAPAALLPDGNVLVAPAPVDINCEWVPPTEFFEFDGTSLTQVTEPIYARYVPSYVGRLLPLPTGQVLYTNSLNYVEIYTPAGTPNASWAPTITSAPADVDPGGTNYPLSGTQFNGLSQADAYGDDYQASTNYPLVRITNNATGHVFYARTHSHSTMAVATGGTPVSTEFDIPAGIETGASSLTVVANGIPSQPVSANVGPTPSPTPTPSSSPTAAPTIAPTPTSVPTSTVASTPTATATPTPTAIPTPPGPAALTVSPKTLAFGRLNYAVAGSNSRTLHVTITNPKKYVTAAIITSLAGSVGFTATTSCNGVTIPAGGKQNCQITYSPTGLGPVSGTLVVTDNAGNSPQMVTLTGTGTQGRMYTTPGSLNFGKVAVNTSVAKTLTLKNRSASTFTISSIDNADPVFVASQNCLGTIVGDSNCAITVTYTPTATIKSTDTLTIVDTPDGITRNVPLSGTGKTSN